MRKDIKNPEPTKQIREYISDLEKAAATYMEMQNTAYPYLEQILCQYWEDEPDYPYPGEIKRILSAMENSDVYMIGEYCRQYLERTENEA